MTSFKLGTLILALAAALAVASTAAAKGGASCAQILDFSVTPSLANGQTFLTTSYHVDNECVDHEKMSSAALDSSNSTTGFVGRSVTMLSYGVNSYASNAANATPGTTYTTTLTVYGANGKIADTRTLSVTVPAA